MGSNFYFFFSRYLHLWNKWAIFKFLPSDVPTFITWLLTKYLLCLWFLGRFYGCWLVLMFSHVYAQVQVNRDSDFWHVVDTDVSFSCFWYKMWWVLYINIWWLIKSSYSPGLVCTSVWLFWYVIWINVTRGSHKLSLILAIYLFE